MKKRLISIFLILAFILTSLAGCGSDDSKFTEFRDPNNEEDEQLLATGYYEVYDKDDKLVGYLRVMSSRIIVYDEDGNEDDSIPYEYNAKKELYTLEGELFGSEEFTMEKSKKKLMLITEDDDEYTLESISKSDMPSGGGKKDPDPDPTETSSGASPLRTYYVGGNAFLDLSAGLTEELFNSLDKELDYNNGYFRADAKAGSSDNSTVLRFTTILISHNSLMETIDKAREEYDGAYDSAADLMYGYYRDYALGDSAALKEGYTTINGREWRFGQVVTEDRYGRDVFLNMLFWMSGEHMAVVIASVGAVDPDTFRAVSDTALDILNSVELEPYVPMTPDWAKTE